MFVEHRDTIGHIVEGDPQLALPLPDFVKQPRILDRDDGLCGETLYQRNLFLAERFHYLAIQREYPKKEVFFPERDGEQSPGPAEINQRSPADITAPV